MRGTAPFGVPFCFRGMPTGQVRRQSCSSTSPAAGNSGIFSPTITIAVEWIPHPAGPGALRPQREQRPEHTLHRPSHWHAIGPQTDRTPFSRLIMNNFILDAVALPQKPQNRIWNSMNKYRSEASIRGTPKRTSSSPEQRNILYLLADQAVAFGIPGDFVEIGCQDGQTTRVIASVIEHHQADRTLHVYNDFGADLGPDALQPKVHRNLHKSGLRRWLIHDGAFRSTLPGQLPAEIAFAHIDCEVDDEPEFHCQCMMRCLQAVYPRMGSGAIGVLMDYHDADRTVIGWDCNPGVKMACDHFFKKKPECIQILYGGRFSQAFFRKA